jgi:hypothetical protein
MTSGADELRRVRGSELVSFDDIADHLRDFATREPDTEETLDRLARFLAAVERVEHDHEGHEGNVGSSITS